MVVIMVHGHLHHRAQMYDYNRAKGFIISWIGANPPTAFWIGCTPIFALIYDDQNDFYSAFATTTPGSLRVIKHGENATDFSDEGIDWSNGSDPYETITVSGCLAQVGHTYYCFCVCISNNQVKMNSNHKHIGNYDDLYPCVIGHRYREGNGNNNSDVYFVQTGYYYPCSLLISFNITDLEYTLVPNSDNSLDVDLDGYVLGYNATAPRTESNVLRNRSTVNYPCGYVSLNPDGVNDFLNQNAEYYYNFNIFCNPQIVNKIAGHSHEQGFDEYDRLQARMFSQNGLSTIEVGFIPCCILIYHHNSGRMFIWLENLADPDNLIFCGSDTTDVLLNDNAIEIDGENINFTPPISGDMEILVFGISNQTIEY